MGLALVLVPKISNAAVKMNLALEYPVAVGTTAQNFNSNLGLSGDIYVDPLIAPWVSNYLTVGYSSLSLRSDTTSSFRLVPVLVGLGLPGKVTDGLTTEMGFGLGAGIGYINSPGATSYRAYGYFMMQARGSVEYEIGSGFSAFARIPVNFIIGTNKMTYLAYSGGVGFKF